MTHILDHEVDGIVQRFNVQGVFVAPGFPYKHVAVADLGNAYVLTLSGLIGNSSEGVLAQGVHAQCVQTLENIKNVIAISCQHLGIHAKENVLEYITTSRVDLADLGSVLELNRAYVDAGMPFTARAAVEVKKLPLNAAVEITVTAVLPKP
jgi:enamine deaminase RidA (YjgF/YER057c/UK114 family)